MNTKKILLSLLSFFALPTFAQTNFTFSPEKPKAGDVISITYIPSGTIANTTSPLNAIVYTLGKTGETANDVSLKKSGNNYAGTVKTDTSDNFVFFSFSADKQFDNNADNGYWIQLYDGDSLKKGANLSLSRFYQFYGRNAGLDADNNKALKYMEAEFKSDPEAGKSNLASYARLYSSVNKEDAPAFIQKQIESELKSGLKNEDDYGTVQNLYGLAKLPQQAKWIDDLKKEKFPNGKWKITETIENFFRESDLAKKQTMLDDITAKIKNDSAWKYLEPSESYFQSVLVGTYQSKQNWQGMDSVIKKYDIKGGALAGIYNNSAWEIQKTDKNLEVAERMSKIATDWSKNEWKSPTDKKPDYLPESQWEKTRANNYGMYADTYAMIMYKLGNFKKGFSYTDEAAMKIAKGTNANFNNTYALLAEKVLPSKKYVKQLEQFVKDGKSTSDIQQILKRAYVKKHGSDTGYDDYMAVLEKDSYLKMVAELKKSILNETVPAFALSDLKGEKINIVDLKNKVVIIDFWATWCGPCKASFPGMQKMVTKYENDPDVKFVFVDTWETADSKEKNASDFIAANKYNFQVLMDNDSKVVDQFKVTGIPTKFVIDKNGVIRFKEIGFDGSDDKLVTKLSTMIDIARKM